MNRIFTSLAAVGLALAVYAAEGETSVAGTPLRVIPIPVNIELEQGVFIVPEQGMTCYIEGERAEQLTGYLEQGPLKWIPVEKAGKADVVIKIGKHSNKCTFYSLRFGCSFAVANTIKPQLL